MLNKHIKIKNNALTLRRKGFSYGYISSKLKISKSTASIWTKKIKLTNEQRIKLNKNKSFHLNYGINSQRERRKREIEKIVSNAKLEIPNKIKLETIKLFGTALFWAEGSKKNMFDMTNSDPYLIAFWVKWLKIVFNIDSRTLKARLNIYPQQSEVSIKRFWSKITGIKVSKFGKTYVKPFSKNYKKNNLYYGTIRIEVPKSTNYRYKVLGWTQKMIDLIVPDMGVMDRKWNKLREVAKPSKIK